MFTTLFLLIAFLFNFFTGIAILQRIIFFDDESDNDGSGSGSPGTCAFPFCSVNSISRVSGVGFSVFVLTGIESIGDVVMLVVFVSREVDSKGGRLI